MVCDTDYQRIEHPSTQMDMPQLISNNKPAIVEISTSYQNLTQGFPLDRLYRFSQSLFMAQAREATQKQFLVHFKYGPPGFRHYHHL
jgi:hypothetical protein